MILTKELLYYMQHNLRLVLFVMNKYFQEFTANGRNFQDFCQAGVKGLITAIDRFEPGRKLQLSTYALFWIRHAIIRSMTLSSFFKVPFGLESVCFHQLCSKFYVNQQPMVLIFQKIKAFDHCFGLNQWYKCCLSQTVLKKLKSLINAG